MYYYIKSQLEWYNLNMNGSTIGGTSKEFLNKQTIRVLKSHMIVKYNLDKEFDFMDKLKADIAQTFKNQSDITKQMMKLVLGGDEIKNEDDEVVNTSNNSTKQTKSTKSVKSTKSARPVEPEPESDTENETNSNTDSDSDSSSDSDDDEESQLEKLGIVKTDLIQFKKLTKDGCTHWLNPKTEKIYSFNIKTNKWDKGKVQLYTTYSDEIEEIKSNIIKSLKDKKNKSTKSKVVVEEDKHNKEEKIEDDRQNGILFDMLQNGKVRRNNVLSIKKNTETTKDKGQQVSKYK